MFCCVKPQREKRISFEEETEDVCCRQDLLKRERRISSGEDMEDDACRVCRRRLHRLHCRHVLCVPELLQRILEFVVLDSDVHGYDIHTNAISVASVSHFWRATLFSILYLHHKTFYSAKPSIMRSSLKHRLPAAFMPPMDLQLFHCVFVHRFLTHYSQNIVQISTTSVRDIKNLIKLFERVNFENLHTLILETENRKYPSQTSLPEPKIFVPNSIILQMFNTVLKKCINLRTLEISEVHVTKRERVKLEYMQEILQLPLTLRSLKWLNPPPWLLKLVLTPNFPKLTKLELYGSQLEGKLVSWMLSLVSESLRYCDLKFFLEYGDRAIPVPVTIPKMTRLRILHLHGADPRYAINGVECFPRLELISLRLCSQSRFPPGNFHLELSNSWYDWNSLNPLDDMPKLNAGLRLPPMLEFDWWIICCVHEWQTFSIRHSPSHVNFQQTSLEND